jgi:hypothetical protein
MSRIRHGVMGALGAGGFALLVSTVLSSAPAQADTGCGPTTVRLASVTAEATDGTITGTPVDGGASVTLSGPLSAYVKSEGFGDTPPVSVQRWDELIDSANTPLPSDDPNWYGRAKARAFMTRTLNEEAVHLPPNTIVVHYSAGDDAPAGWCSLSSIQPVAQQT